MQPTDQFVRKSQNQIANRMPNTLVLMRLLYCIYS